MDAPPDRPDPALATVWMVRALVVGLALAPFLGWSVLFPFATALRAAGASLAVAYGGGATVLLALLVVGLIVGARTSARSIRFEFDALEVRVRRGRFVRTVQHAPLVRVQAVNVRRGLLERRWGLATVELRLATRVDDPAPLLVRLPGLRVADDLAAAITRRLAARGSSAPTSPPPLKAAR